jgi:hypothetical protein
MNIDTLIELLVDALIADASILSWCNTNYSTPHTIYKGIDLSNPPGEDEYPLIAIWPISKTSGYQLAEKAHVIQITSGIYDSTFSSDTDTNLVTVKRYRGVSRTEAFRKLVETAVVAEIGSNTNTTELVEEALEISYEPIEFFPSFFATDIYVFNEPISAGDDIFS